MKHFPPNPQFVAMAIVAWMTVALRISITGVRRVMAGLSGTFGNRLPKISPVITSIIALALLVFQPLPLLAQSPPSTTGADSVEVESSGESRGQATNEIEQWRTIIRNNTERIHNVEEDVLGLRSVFREEAETLKAELSRYRQDPQAHRRDLQGATASSLVRIAEETASILERREETILGAMEIERKSREKAATYRAESEQLDNAIPMQQSLLAQMQAENDALKEKYLQDPGNRDLQRQLREKYREETRLNLQLQFDERRSRLLAAASTKLDQAADRVQTLSDGLEDTLDNIELVQLDCRQNAQLLTELMQVEDEIDAFTGGAEIGVLMGHVGEMTDLTEQLTDTIGQAMEAFLEPAPVPGGPTTPPDTGFDRWLNSRSN